MSKPQERLKDIIKIVEINRIVDWEQFTREQIQEEFRQIELIAKGLE
tara:strand:+ start:1576 stop:1716 length:141 start_codon:yes stop_codon:yes gene_type:complete